MSEAEHSVVDWDQFAAARVAMGGDFLRLLGYFREDGEKAIAAIEAAMRARNAVAMVNPAARFEQEAREFGAETLAELVDHIEQVARHCIEWKHSPDELLTDIIKLRGVFDATMAAFDAHASPLLVRKGPQVRAGNRLA